MRIIKQNTNARNLVFLMVDSGDHITGKTGLTPTVTLSKNGGAFGAGTGTITAVGNGVYSYAPIVGDADTLGSLILHATAAGADPVDLEFEVVAFDPRDAVRMGQTALPNATAGALNGLPLSADTSGRVDVLKINGTSQTARDIGASVLLSPGTGTGQVNLALGRVGVNWGDVTNQSTIVNLSSTTISTSQAVGSVSGAVGSVTGNVGGDVAGKVLGGGASTITGDGVRAASVTGSVGSVTGTVTANTTQLAGQTVTAAAGVTFPASVSSLTAANVWATDVSAYATAGQAGTYQNKTDVLTSSRMATYTQPTGFLAATFPSTVASPTNITSVGSVTGSVASVTGDVGGKVLGGGASAITGDGVRASSVTGSVNSVTSIVTANTTQWAGVAVTGMPMPTYTQPTGFLAATFPSSVSSLTAANVWDTNISGYTTAGYAGTYLKGAGSAGDPWSTAIPGAYGVGTAGYIVGTNLNATISSRMASYTQPTGFLTATFPSTVASTTNITAASGVTLAAVTHTGATIPTVTTVTNAVTAGTVNDKTGYSLSGSQTFSTTGSVGSVTGAVGSVTGAVTVGTINANVINAASIATNAIDADALAADAVAEIQSGLSTLTSGQVENAVWDATMTGHTGATTYGGRIVRAANSNVTVQITGAQHIASDIHELQPAVIDNTHFAAGAIDNNALATNAAQEIADAVLGRNIAGGSSTGRTVTEALRFLRNKFTVAGTTLTVYQEDDTTVSWTSTVSTSATAEPITGSDPA